MTDFPQIKRIVETLITHCDSRCQHSGRGEDRVISVEKVAEIVRLLRNVLLPGYFEEISLSPTVYLSMTLEKATRLLKEQIVATLCFTSETKQDKTELEVKADGVVTRFLDRIPEIRAQLSSDILAAHKGDPASIHIEEIVFCYPGIKAVINHRIAHTLYSLGISMLPRIISEMSHSETGIDIHPGACIGKSFFIDHGTGVVIGSTSIIGENVKIYQGVTLGAKSFTVDENGEPVKGVPRHPILEDNVTVYANATILGRITIGEHAVIGGNVWVTSDVGAGKRILQGHYVAPSIYIGGGI